MGLRVETPPAPAATPAAFTGGNYCYVSPGGNDATGARNSLAKPFLTIAAALAASSAGDTIFLAPGTYTENVTWLEQRSLLGSGARVSIVSGTLTLTAGATAVANNLNVSAVQITGATVFNFAAKSAGTSKLFVSDCIMGGNWTLTPRAGADLADVLSCSFANTLENKLPFFKALGSYFGGLAFTDGAGGMIATATGCVIDAFAAVGGGSTFALAGCRIASSLAMTDGGGGAITTTGCDLRAATLTINSGTWHEYGCSLDQSSIAGASGNKRVSFQRLGSTACAGLATTTITLPVPIGQTDYHVSATPLSIGASLKIVFYITNKTGTAFDLVMVSDDAINFEFGISYRQP